MNVNTLKYLFIIVAVFLAACATPESDAPKPGLAPEETLDAQLAELDRVAGDAWAKKDPGFFENHLADDFISQTPFGPVDKASIIRDVASSPCDVKSIVNEEGKVVTLAEGVAIRTSKEVIDGKCGDVELPDGRIATLFVKEGEAWKIAFHQSLYLNRENDEAEETEKSEPGSGKKETEGVPAEDKPAALGPEIKVKIPNDPELAEELGALEKEMLAAWAKKDTAFFEKYLADDYTEINPQGVVGRDWLLKDVGEHNCDISHEISDLKATKIGYGIVILTYKVKESGTCEGRPLYYQVPLFTTSIWKTDGSGWKFAFHMATPGGG